jgi:hypothetical protein
LDPRPDGEAITVAAQCQETLALEAAANVLDTRLTDDLRLMIERTEEEVRVITQKRDALRLERSTS